MMAVGSSETDRWWIFRVPKVKCWNEYVIYATRGWWWLVKFGVDRMVRKTTGIIWLRCDLLASTYIMHEESVQGNENMSEILLQKESDGKRWQWNEPSTQSRQQTQKLMQELEIYVFGVAEGSLPQDMVPEWGGEVETCDENLMGIFFSSLTC